MQQGGITIFTFILLWYWRNIAREAIYISATLSEGSLKGEGFQNSQGWPLHFFPKGYVMFYWIGAIVCCWPHHHVKWLPYQRSWHETPVAQFWPTIIDFGKACPSEMGKKDVLGHYQKEVHQNYQNYQI